MNITYIIGNGFDINLGLDTSYESFINCYCNDNDDNNPVIKQLKYEIKSNKKEWKDAEIALGRSTQSVMDKKMSSEDYYVFYNDILEELAKYLVIEQNTIAAECYDEELVKSFGKAVNSYFAGIKPTEQDTILKFTQRIDGGNRYIFLNFNYTNIIDNINYKYKQLNIPDILGQRKVSNTIYNNQIVKNIHVHGKTDGYLIFGVDNEAQLSNVELFKNDDLLKRLLIKTEADSIIGEKTDEEAYKYLRNSDIVYLYGVSIGETDSIWWKRILELLQNNLKAVVIVFCYDLIKPEIKASKTPYDKELISGMTKEKLINYGNFNDKTKEQLKKRIFISDVNIFEDFATVLKNKKKINLGKGIVEKTIKQHSKAIKYPLKR